VFAISGKLWFNVYPRWLDNFKKDLVKTGWGAVEWFGLAQDKDKWRALVNALMNILVQ
jgi:hypothetical protein